MPKKVKGGEKILVQWGASSDADNNISGYLLERSDDNGTYKQIYSGNARRYEDTAPKTVSSVRYRARAADSYGEKSGYRTSDLVQVVNNRPPSFTVDSHDYGVVSKDFEISFILSDPDEGDAVTAKVLVDDVEDKDFSVNTKGFVNKYPVKLSDFRPGKHTVKVVATDKDGATSTATYRFTTINHPPKFHLEDGDLGGKNGGFFFTYRISDAEGERVDVVEYLDDTVLRARDNVDKDTDLTVEVAEDRVREFAKDETHVLRIEAKDASGGTATLTQTFHRTNFPPILSGVDEDLGVVEEKDANSRIEYTVGVSDPEGDTCHVRVYVDDVEKETYEAVGKEVSHRIVIEGEEFLKLAPGSHVLRIEAEDSIGLVSRRVITFTRRPTRLLAEFRTPIETDAAARKVFLVPNWRLAEGAKGTLYACNNAFDEQPAWEDVTSMSTTGLDYHFKNAKRTADKWGISVRVVVERGDATGNSYVYGVGGAFE